ncbi:hypothetical protein ANANG_G00141950 [Anguilla anguilla]|uniref:Uncharacterized protein n=1 Tax=Anguilla anguilla TaxID=7936 RepID=A0A9D3MCM0_ANGAN|nr:hypothetical protein ANANG_G00141950 [Anguilla anguilla]
MRSSRCPTVPGARHLTPRAAALPTAGRPPDHAAALGLSDARAADAPRPGHDTGFLQPILKACLSAVCPQRSAVFGDSDIGRRASRRWGLIAVLPSEEAGAGVALRCGSQMPGSI